MSFSYEDVGRRNYDECVKCPDRGRYSKVFELRLCVSHYREAVALVRGKYDRVSGCNRCGSRIRLIRFRTLGGVALCPECIGVMRRSVEVWARGGKTLLTDFDE